MSSTEKVRFIRQTAAFFVASHIGRPDADRAIAWAEALWDKLSARGYGVPDKETKPRESKDYYAELSENQQKWFCAFWQAFAYKQGRNDAAMRWRILGELSDAEYKHIVEAAKVEAARVLPQGQVRKMAQGWLFEQRWKDYEPVKAAIVPANKSLLLSNLMADLENARRMKMYAVGPEQNDYWNEKIEEIKLKAIELNK